MRVAVEASSTVGSGGRGWATGAASRMLVVGVVARSGGARALGIATRSGGAWVAGVAWRLGEVAAPLVAAIEKRQRRGSSRGQEERQRRLAMSTVREERGSGRQAQAEAGSDGHAAGIGRRMDKVADWSGERRAGLFDGPFFTI